MSVYMMCDYAYIMWTIHELVFLLLSFGHSVNASVQCTDVWCVFTCI